MSSYAEAQRFRELIERVDLLYARVEILSDALTARLKRIEALEERMDALEAQPAHPRVPPAAPIAEPLPKAKPGTAFAKWQQQKQTDNA